MQLISGILLPFGVGLCYFLIGLYTMRMGFEHLAGERMKAVVMRFTRTPGHSFLSGLAATLVLQSSSAVTVLTIGLTQAGAIPFAQTIGIILGTNIGTTVTTELIALRLEDYAIPLMLIGVCMWLLKNDKLRNSGLILAGFGLIFLGIDTIQLMAVPLQQSTQFQQMFLDSRHSVLIGLVTGTMFTALIQSSSATLAITMSMMSHQIMSLETALAIVLGANIGTCFTALIASIGANSASRQVAWCHTLFNLVGALLFIPLLDGLGKLSVFLTADPSQQIAHAQTIFNLVCSLLALPFAAQIARAIQWLIPDQGNK